MKRNFIYSILVLVLVLSSCDDYLDVQPKGRTLLEKTTEYEAVLQDPWSKFYDTYPAGIIANEKWTLDESSIINNDDPYTTTNFLWNEDFDRTAVLESDQNGYNYAYKRIAQSNIVIHEINDSEGDTELKKQVRAQALAIRAFNHFVLINLHAKHYDPQTAGTDMGIILRTDFNIETEIPQSTVQDAYDLIEEDINQALENLPQPASDKMMPSQAFGYALKAKVHLFKKEFDQALAAANTSLALNNSIFDYNALTAGASLTVDLDENLLYRPGFNQWAPYFETIGPTTIAMFDPVDIRLTKFFSTSPFLPVGAMSFSSFFDKFNVAGMKVSEVLLMKAECLARAGQVNEAIAVVNELRQNRFASTDYVDLIAGTTTETVKMILDERARELVLTYNRFWDLRRINTEDDYKVTLTKEFDGNTYTLAPGSHLYIIPFSREAIDRNSTLQQNTK